MEITKQKFNELFIEISKDMTEDDYILTNQSKFICQQFYYMINGATYLSLDPQNKEIVENRKMKGFYIAGGVGTGKSTLLNILLEIAKRCGVKYQIKGEEINFCVMRNIFTATELCKEYREYGMLQDYCCCVAIDDIGSEEEYTSYMGSKINVIEETILNRYCKNYTITFATSNYPIDEKYLKYSERCISRMRKMFAYYELTGEDRRYKS